MALTVAHQRSTANTQDHKDSCILVPLPLAFRDNLLLNQEVACNHPGLSPVMDFFPPRKLSNPHFEASRPDTIATPCGKEFPRLIACCGKHYFILFLLTLLTDTPWVWCCARGKRTPLYPLFTSPRIILYVSITSSLRHLWIKGTPGPWDGLSVWQKQTSL